MLIVYQSTENIKGTNFICIGSDGVAKGSTDNQLDATNKIYFDNYLITHLYCQAGAITQSCDPRLKENIQDVDHEIVKSALMDIRIISASYRDLEEFKSSNSNDKTKLMWDAGNISKISLFAKDVNKVDREVTPLDENGNPLILHSYINENGEVIKEKITETIENCKEFTPNKIMQALVVDFQEHEKEIQALKKEIEELKNK